MSLGIPDPTFALWLREQFENDRGRCPFSFKEFPTWPLEHQQSLREKAVTWPSYFRPVLTEVLERYGELSKALEKS